MHIGVRPRVPPGDRIVTPGGSSSARSQVKGKSKERGDGMAPRDAGDWAKRREGYGEVHSDVQDSSSTAGSSRSDSTSQQDEHGDQHFGIENAAPAKSDKGKRGAAMGQQRALPRMTLEQAMLQYEKDHPSTTALSVPGQAGKEKVAAGSSIDWETSRDAPAHDGIYTYDYSGRSSATTTTGTGASSSASKQSRGSVLHVDGTEGPVHAYPPPPEHENAYGVPFGKRLKALVNMRNEAEANGLVPIVEVNDARRTLPQKSKARSGLARRPAVIARERVFPRGDYHADNGQAESGRRNQDGLHGAVMSHVDSGTSEFSDSTPTQSPGYQGAPTIPQTPSTSPQKRGHTENIAQVGRESAPVTPSSKSEPTKRKIEGKQRRKPVPGFIGEGERVKERPESGRASVEKQKSGSDLKQYAAGQREQGRRENNHTSLGKRLV